ncbi:O-antigen ligase family protein [Enterobacter asburiae]|uniref:O-antigen ligase family protein n=1 Tax=Enterobacter asburiae TaxID=61645 RepID=UPI00192C154D|nr:O-antigen ligase family protein [Enterobacter asburiae]MBL5841178.1 O-antigen ligase family protein [Enterobacter asburiae]MBL5912408.1 O-antigen ligase family protein [Enterobacter asburiae]MBL5941546.1 O-antigen ligase family protein [Enterobacter asburiae]
MTGLEGGTYSAARRGRLTGLWLLPGLWLCGGLLFVFPQHGGTGTELPQNLLAWSVMAGMVMCAVLCTPRGEMTLPAGSLMTGAGLLLWSLPLLWSWYPDWFMNALPRVAGLWGLAALYCLLLRAMPGTQVRRYWLMILVLAALLQAGAALKQAVHPELLTGGRPVGGFMQVNVLSSFLATGLACALALCFRDRGPGTRLLTGIALGVLPAMLVLLQSRAGWLGGLTAALILLWVNRDETGAPGCRPSRRAAALMLLSVVAGLLWLWAGHRLFPGSGLSPVGKEGSTASRLYLLDLTWQLISAHPIIGNGYGSFEALFGRLAQGIPPGLEADTVTHPHNELLYAWVEGGLTAVAGLLLMVLAVLRRLWGPGGTRLTGLALLLPLALHVNLEYPLDMSVSHSLTLVLLLVIAGPDAAPAPRVTFTSGGSVPAVQGLSALIRWLPALPAAGVLFFMLSGLVTHQRLMAVERAGLIPLADNEAAVLASLPNPYSLHTRIEFDRHVALLLRYNRTRDPSLLVLFQQWAQNYLQTHNDPQVYLSLLRIARAQQNGYADTLCRQAHGRWPARPEFVGCQR